MQPSPVTLSLAMIVKDETDSLIKCLESVKDYVDEIIVVHNGQNKVEIQSLCDRFGAQYYYKEWTNDFSVQRNYSFSLCTKDYILWLDADDVVEGAENLRKLDSEINCYLLPYRVDTITLYRERIVKRALGAQWAGRIHECLDAGPGTKFDSVTVVHQVKSAEQRNESHLLKLSIETEEYSSVPRLLYYYARDLYNAGNIVKAKALFKAYIELPGTWVDEKYSAFMQLASIAIVQEAYKEAALFYQQAIALMPSQRLAYFGMARLHYFDKDWQQVVIWSDIGRARPQYSGLLFINRLDETYNWIIHYTFALIQLKQYDVARRWTDKALAINPKDAMHLQNQRFLETICNTSEQDS